MIEPANPSHTVIAIAVAGRRIVSTTTEGGVGSSSSVGLHGAGAGLVFAGRSEQRAAVSLSVGTCILPRA